MFLKRGHNDGDNEITGREKNHVEEPVIQKATARLPKGTNTIIKGSKLIGDINVTCDLELSGEIEGNITSEHDSSIVIKGSCKGNISTKEGDVTIEGELHKGNISAGNNVTISGKFKGGEVSAKGKISVNGEFDGRLEGSEIEIGPGAQGKGELFYRESISIAKGAIIEGEIHKVPNELKLVKSSPEETNAETTTPSKDISNG